jgi:hypothetical protein
MEDNEILHTKNADIPFTVNAREITVLDQQFSCRYIRKPDGDVSIRDATWKSTTLSERMAILQKMEGNEGFSAWISPDWYQSGASLGYLASVAGEYELPTPLSSTLGAIVGMFDVEMVNSFGGISAGIHENRIT